MKNTQELSDRELVILCQQRDETALQTLMDRYTKKLKFLQRRKWAGRKDIDIDDVIQDVWMGLLGDLEYVLEYLNDERASLLPYLSQAAYRQLQDVCKSISRRNRRHVEKYYMYDLDHESGEPMQVDTPCEGLLDAERIDKLHEAANWLAPKYRDALDRSLRGFSSRAIGRLESIHHTTASRRLDASVVEIKKLLRPYFAA